MVARVAVVLLVTSALAGCSSMAGSPGPAPFPRANRPGTPVDAPAPAPVAPPAQVAALLDTALGLRGIAYRLGGDRPATGFDCSGLVHYVFAQQAIDLPRTVIEQFAVGQPIAPGEIRAGDLLFFSTTAKGATHVGIALGPLSQGEFVHAPGTGSVVRVERFDTPYWRARWIGAKRLAP